MPLRSGSVASQIMNKYGWKEGQGWYKNTLVLDWGEADLFEYQGDCITTSPVILVV